MRSLIYYIRYSAFAIVGMIWISSCSKTETTFVDEELQLYFDVFLAEANKRNIDIETAFTDLGGEIIQIDSPNIIAQCEFNSHQSNVITVDKVSWNNMSEMEKEYVIFHELGHCVLDRAHNNEKDELGICLSMMESGENKCKKHYTNETRTQLIDELFQ